MAAKLKRCIELAPLRFQAIHWSLVYLHLCLILISHAKPAVCNTANCFDVLNQHLNNQRKTCFLTQILPLLGKYKIPLVQVYWKTSYIYIQNSQEKSRKSKCATAGTSNHISPAFQASILTFRLPWHTLTLSILAPHRLLSAFAFFKQCIL